LVTAAQEIKYQQNELRTAAFTEFRFQHGDAELAFYASFNTETCRLDYNIVQNGFDVKLVTDVEPAVFVQYGEFIRLHEAWAAGLSDRPVFVSEIPEPEYQEPEVPE
jgi:hypothetical protein